MEEKKEHTLFGGDKGWNSSEWTSSDDRVRGGKSQSYLSLHNSTARFHGHLDISALGGAGFASQRTASDTETWDLSSYDGIKLSLGKSDGKRYTFILKDELLPKDPDTGREQSTISYEYDFNFEGEGSEVEIAWKDLKPTYRGKPKDNAKKLDTGNVKRFSVMMRSFFGDQEGDFSLEIMSIKAVSFSKAVEKSLWAKMWSMVGWE